MFVLLPPSETKRAAAAPSHCELLQEIDAVTKENNKHNFLVKAGPDLEQVAKIKVAEALKKLSANPDDRAYKSLKLKPSSKAQEAFKANIQAYEFIFKDKNSLALPALYLYTGVLYDAIELQELDSKALKWLNLHVFVQSALYGLVNAFAPLNNYRLSASSSLPLLEKSLKKHWQEIYAEYNWPTTDFILDLRSTDYAALNPLPKQENCAWLEIVTRENDGTVRALNHFNKAAKGKLVKALAQSAPDIANVQDLIEWASAEKIEIVKTSTGKLQLITNSVSAKINKYSTGINHGI